MRPRDWRSFLFGIAVGVAGAMVWPALRRAGRPVMKGLLGGAMQLQSTLRGAAARTWEEVENIVAEAQYEQELCKAQQPMAQPPTADSPD